LGPFLPLLCNCPHFLSFDEFHFLFIKISISFLEEKKE
jgi:hypothetical protein